MKEYKMVKGTSTVHSNARWFEEKAVSLNYAEANRPGVRSNDLIQIVLKLQKRRVIQWSDTDQSRSKQFTMIACLLTGRRQARTVSQANLSPSHYRLAEMRAAAEVAASCSGWIFLDFFCSNYADRLVCPRSTFLASDRHCRPIFRSLCLRRPR